MARNPAPPSPRTPAPTAEYVQGLYQTQQSQGDEQTLRSTIAEMRTLTSMTHAIEVPSQYQAITTVVRTPFAKDSWLRVTAALTQNPPVARVTPRQETKPMRSAAALAAKWTMAATDQMLHPATQDVKYEAVRQLVRDQESVIKVVHRPDAWANFPKRARGESADTYNQRADDFKKNAFPFGWRVVDRLQMLFGDGEFGDDWALEYGEYPRPYLANRYGMVAVEDDGASRLVNPQALLGGEPKPEGELVSSTGMAVKIEFWDADWWAVVIDGTLAPGFPKRNPYTPRLPYMRARVSDPVLLPLRYLVPALDAMITMKTNWAYLSAYPTPVSEALPNQLAPNIESLAGADAETPVTWHPGMLHEMPTGRTLKFLAPPPTGQDLNQMISLLRDLVDVAGVPSVFRGMGGSDQAGYAINQLIAAATLTYKILAQQAEKQLEDVGEFLWWVVANRIRQTVFVDDPQGGDGAKESIGLSPSGPVTAQVAPIDMLRQLDYQFRPVLPTDEQSRAMIAMQLVNAPKQLVSKRHAQEKYLQVDDPQAMQDEIWVEQTLDTDPVLHEKVVGEALRQAGLMPATPPPSPLVGPNGQPLSMGNIGQPPGQAGAGTPSVQGINQPLAAEPPQVPAIAGGTGGRPAGVYPGRPNTPVQGG